MPELTRQEIIDAYDAVDELHNAACALNWGSLHDREDDLADTVIKALPPKPTPTLEEIAWYDHMHFLAEAEDEDGKKYIMISPQEDGIRCIFNGKKFPETDPIPRKGLTPTGKKYKLAEIQDDE